VNDSSDLHALVFVQLVFEDAERPRSAVEHEVRADQSARVGKSVRKLCVGGHQEQPWRLGSIGADDDGTRSLKALASVAIEIQNACGAPLSVGLDARDVAVRPHLASSRRLRFRNHGGER
jgi:hypothetical protein